MSGTWLLACTRFREGWGIVIDCWEWGIQNSWLDFGADSAEQRAERRGARALGGARAAYAAFGARLFVVVCILRRCARDERRQRWSASRGGLERGDLEPARQPSAAHCGNPVKTRGARLDRERPTNSSVGRSEPSGVARADSVLAELLSGKESRWGVASELRPVRRVEGYPLRRCLPVRIATPRQALRAGRISARVRHGDGTCVRGLGRPKPMARSFRCATFCSA